MSNHPTDVAGRLRYWAQHPAGQCEPMRADLVAGATEIDNLRHDLQIQAVNAATVLAAQAERDRLREAVCLYVRSKKDGLGRNALDWWRLQEIESEFTHDVGAKHG